ncbi:MAG: hypothetical protein KY475_26310 [Planctomycetes bacterium]|nr:hypothetical protein [Planctomycetota bacterium]
MAAQEHNDADSPGRTRTWWHPMLVATLQWALQDSYEVRDEVSVGRMPLRIDILILRRLGELPEIAKQELGPLVQILNEYTAVEFKSPSDAIEIGDLDQLLGCVHLFRSQQRPPLERGKLSLAILAPAISSALRDDVERLGLTISERHGGVWEITGGLFPLWVIETDRLAEHAESVLAFFSRNFLRDAKPIIERWCATGHAEIVDFIVQQIEQFKRRGESFTMQHKDAQVMERTWEEFQAAAIAAASPEKRLEGLSPEKRLEGLSPEKRLEGLSPEDVLKGLSEADRKRLRELLEQQSFEDNSNGGDAAK